MLRVPVKTIAFCLVVLLCTFSEKSMASLDFTEEEKTWLASNSTLTVGYANIVEPLYMDTGGVVKGIIPDIYSIISEKHGIKFNFVTKNWGDIITETYKGNIDIIPMMARKTAQKNGLLSTENYYNHFFRVFANRGLDVSLNSLSDLNHLKIAYPKNILVLDAFLNNQFKKSNLVPSNTPHDAFIKVLNGEADVAIAFHTSGHYIINEFFLNEIEPKFVLTDIKLETVSGIRPDLPILQSIINKINLSLTSEDKTNVTNKWTNKMVVNYLTEEEIKYINNNKFTTCSQYDFYPYSDQDGDHIIGISGELLDTIETKLN